MRMETQEIGGVTVSAAMAAPRRPTPVIDVRGLTRHEGANTAAYMITRLLVEPPNGPVAP